MPGLFDNLPPTSFELVAGIGVCDFCVARERAVWTYPCKSFEMPGGREAFGGRVPMSDGDWGACEACSELIEANEREALTKRCIPDTDKRFVKELRAWQRDLLNAFFKNRTGERFRHAPTDYEKFEATVLIEDPDMVEKQPDGSWKRVPGEKSE